jgi:hypothetical protein
VLPRDVDRPYYDAVLAACHDAGTSPTLIECAILVAVTDWLSAICA